MEPVWNDLLTCDYERTRPTATALEWELYTRSLLAWPATLLGICELYGRLRRPASSTSTTPSTGGYSATGTPACTTPTTSPTSSPAPPNGTATPT